MFRESSSDENFYGFPDSEVNSRRDDDRGDEDSDMSLEEVSSGS